MLPGGLVLENSSNYGIVKTEALFGFGQGGGENFVNVQMNDTKPLEWLITPVSLERSLQESSRALAVTNAPKKAEGRHKKAKKKHAKKSKRKGKVKKCVFKILKKNGKRRKSKRNKNGMNKKKYILPLILGLLAAKSILIPIALKALAFMSAKGFLMGFFSTILASFLSIKGMFDHTHRYQDRKDEKTQVEIIQVPTKTEDHYYDSHYKRGDFVPMIS